MCLLRHAGHTTLASLLFDCKAPLQSLLGQMQHQPNTSFHAAAPCNIINHWQLHSGRLTATNAINPLPALNVFNSMCLSAGVLLCACTAEARVKLAREFSTSTELAVASSTATSPAAIASVQQSTTGKDLAHSLHGKVYRALASGIVQCDKVQLPGCMAIAVQHFTRPNAHA